MTTEGHSYRTYIAYAISLSEFEEYDMAIGMYSRAIELEPKKVNAYQLLANLYSTIGQLDEAVETYKKILHAVPNEAKTYLLLGNAHYLQGDVEKAIASYRAAIKLEPDNDEHKLVYNQVLNEYIDKKRGGVKA